ncbi:hypothetical protein BDN71DRAFT_1431667 [Pleurotus eryngii]|uniref:Uncharacterized protein n=1 Tax=Pleurotus eryngii TaxID=5323 RepID=A0A9P6DEX4_PLEER|nr:hypothetical protein BDN71DRAFT_1431667 [Pleurotus eryngii]
MFLTHYPFQREHLLLHVPTHVHIKCIFTLVNEGPNTVVLYGCYDEYKALSTNDGCMVNLTELTSSSDNEANLGHLVDQGGAHANECVQHTPAMKPGKAYVRYREGTVSSEKRAQASGAGKAAMKWKMEGSDDFVDKMDATGVKPSCKLNKWRNMEETSVCSQSDANSKMGAAKGTQKGATQGAALGRGCQSKATEAKEHL